MFLPPSPQAVRIFFEEIRAAALGRIRTQPVDARFPAIFLLLLLMVTGDALLFDVSRTHAYRFAKFHR
jgi:hypothetical protein